MPELPEVETIKNSLGEKLIGLTITGAAVAMPKVIREPAAEEFIARVTDQQVTRLSRRGKYLLLHLSGDEILMVHLRMTGRLVNDRPETPPPRHTHVVFHLSDGSELRFADMRQFGRLLLVRDGQLEQVKGFKDLGPEPLGDDFSREFLRRELKRKRVRLKSLLLDQTFIAGLGNIYADEALHRSHLHPERIARTLTTREIATLYHSIVEVLQEAIANRGTSVRDYVDGDGHKGGFQELLRVYNREGQPCYYCGAAIIRVKIGGRSSYFCPACQKET
ncbi:MAG: bifunctional DNA-formamidopyrimidine glycosylase/DNA-(apurinic or apyrimidinic site) lyase [Firmicutes bacterium]|nr:bifunctional DNA-formamidopyrimidine glycosylase/DNA-(apurinic or apyrimidinic site) lyase [Bacillota bacterium]